MTGPSFLDFFFFLLVYLATSYGSFRIHGKVQLHEDIVDLWSLLPLRSPRHYVVWCSYVYSFLKIRKRVARLWCKRLSTVLFSSISPVALSSWRTNWIHGFPWLSHSVPAMQKAPRSPGDSWSLTPAGKRAVRRAGPGEGLTGLLFSIGFSIPTV